MMPTPHLHKLRAALANPKCPASDKRILKRAEQHYHRWIGEMQRLTPRGRARVDAMVELLNGYKDTLEVDLIAKQASAFLRRQKGQLKLDNSVIEEFLPYLVSPDVISGVSHTQFLVGPQKSLMSLAFKPRGFDHLGKRPEVVLKLKDQDFIIGTLVHYRFASSAQFGKADTSSGQFALAVFAAECKANLDKTMFQEAAGTASRMKHGCPVAKYYVLAEYLDMVPEDTRLTDIDNVYLLRKVRRLPVGERTKADAIEEQHRAFPVSADVVWAFANEIEAFIQAVWYDPDEALKRGSFAP